MNEALDNAPVCHECGAYVPQLDELKESLVRQSRRETRLQQLVNRLRRTQGEQDPALVEQALEVGHYWKQLLAPKTRELKGPRIDNTYRRLVGDGTADSGYPVDELKRAVYGYYCCQYVVDGKRCLHGKPEQRHIDLELIMRDAKHVDAGLALADHNAHEDVARMHEGMDPKYARVCDCGHPRANHMRPDLVYKFLVARFGEDEAGKLWMPMAEPCCETGCECVSFDTIKARVDETIERWRTPKEPQRQPEALPNGQLRLTA